MEEPSLSDFASGTDAADSENEPTVPAADTDECAVPSTYRWEPTGRVCPACERTVRAGWRTDDGFVCADCKDW